MSGLIAVPALSAMPAAPLPANEPERLAALCRLEVLDTPPEEAFERITSLAARLFSVPISVVSLIDQDRQWFKSCYGLDTTQTDRRLAFCAHAILYPSPFVVLDAQLDDRFADNLLVTSEPHIRFYAGAVLRSRDGYNLGTLCLIDRKPRIFDEKQRASLQDLAALVMRELELRIDAITIHRTHTALKQLIEKVSAVTGDAFFQTLVHHLSSSLGVEHALVGKLGHDREDRFKTIAVCRHEERVDNFELTLAAPLDGEHESLQLRLGECLGNGPAAGYAAVVLRDCAGQPLGLLAVFDPSNLTNVPLVNALLEISAIRASAELERVQSVEALRKSQQMLQLVMDNIPQAVCWKDRHSVYLGCNRNFATNAGLEQAEAIVGKTDYDLPWGATEAEAYRALDQQVMAEDQPSQVIESQLQATGEQAWLSTNKVPLHDARGQVIGVLCTHEDITEYRRAEVETRRALERERELSELKSRFITTASHEFRTPLSTILAAAELLQNYEDKLSPAKKHTYFQRITRAVSEMIALLDDVLIIGAEEVGKLGFKPTALDPTKFCSELVEEMSLGIGLEHEFHFSHDDRCRQSHMDEQLLRHILSNLLSNAVKYSPKAGPIYLHLYRHEGQAVFQVCDEGIGIPAEDQEHLFESFYRGRNVGNISGTGLGLAIVQRAVALHGGSVGFKSDEAGTTFTITLPLQA